MSSKSARLRRRQAAKLRRYKRLRKAGKLPVHTLTERRRAALDRQHQRQAEAARIARLRQVAWVTVAGVGAAGFVAVTPLAWHSEHRPYPFVTAEQAGIAWPDRPDLPHNGEPHEWNYDPFVSAGTTAVATRVGPYPSGGYSRSWYESGRYDRWGPQPAGL